MSRQELDNHWVPHIVALPNLSKHDRKQVAALDYRQEFGISPNVTVFCRHGGSGTFDIPWVQDAVCEVAKEHGENVHFIFLGTTPWGDCTQRFNIHFIPETPSTIVKEAYFRACNVMIHGRSDGEMFSMAIAESSVHNLPIITTLIRGTPLQPVVLKGKAFVYQNQDSLINHLMTFIARGVPKNVNYNAYEEYSPKAVMERFSRIFIEGPLNKTYLNPGSNECFGYYGNDITEIAEVLQKNETSGAKIELKFAGVIARPGSAKKKLQQSQKRKPRSSPSENRVKHGSIKKVPKKATPSISKQSSTKHRKESPSQRKDNAAKRSAQHDVERDVQHTNVESFGTNQQSKYTDIPPSILEQQQQQQNSIRTTKQLQHLHQQKAYRARGGAPKSPMVGGDMQQVYKTKEQMNAQSKMERKVVYQNSGNIRGQEELHTPTVYRSNGRAGGTITKRPNSNSVGTARSNRYPQ
jgi:hypothetical protein